MAERSSGEPPRADPGDHLDVSVIVPVYNPGEFIEPCIASLLAQTMPADRLELIFVDDAATDGTAERLDALAAEHPQVRVIHREVGSGWSGQPRNDGIEIARGRYLQFVDQDDSLGPEALARLVALADRVQADVVIGKVITNGRRISRHLFDRNRDHTSIRELPLEDSLTPHKMFRRSMIMERGIRFPTAKRLEDQPFVLASYFAARNVAILADYPCYHFLRRDDGGNLSFTTLDPVVYYQNLRGILDVAEAGTEPGQLRDRILTRFFRSEIVTRLSEPILLNLSPENRAKRFAEAQAVAAERLGPRIADRLPPITRMRAELILDNDLDGLVEFATRLSGITSSARVEQLRWSGDTLKIRAAAAFRLADDTPMRLRRAGDDLYLDPRLTQDLLPPERTRIGAASDLRKICSGTAAVVGRETKVEWPLTGGVKPAAQATEPAGSQLDGLVEVVLQGTLTLDPQQGAQGAPLAADVWDASVQLRLSGLTQTRRLRIGDGGAAVPAAYAGTPMRLIAPYATKDVANLSIDVDGTIAPATARLAEQLPPSAGASLDRDRIDVPVPLIGIAGAAGPIPGGQLVLTSGTAELVVPASLERTSATWVISALLRQAVGAVTPGEWQVGVRLDAGSAPLPAGSVVVPSGPLRLARPRRTATLRMPGPGRRLALRPALGALKRRARRVLSRH